jgi:hypothetical protein
LYMGYIYDFLKKVASLYSLGHLHQAKAEYLMKSTKKDT